MFKTIIIVLLSFFSVIGVIEFTLTVLNVIATRNIKSVEEVSLIIRLNKDEDNINFLMSCALNMSNDIFFNDKECKVKLIVNELSAENYILANQFANNHDNIELLSEKNIVETDLI